MLLSIRAGGDYLASMYCAATRLPIEDFGLEHGLNHAFVHICRPVFRHIGHWNHWATFDQGT